MKCIICEKPNEFSMKEAEKPIPQVGEVLVKIKRVGICGTDLHAYQGNQPYFTYPRILGHELSGVIEGLGDGVVGWKQGDQVTIIPYMECGECVACTNGKPNCCTNINVVGVHKEGGMCEYLTVPADHLMKTEGLSLDESALIEPFSIGEHAVRRANVKAGEWVLVVGAGPIGLGVMASVKQKGAKVIAMDVNHKRLQFSCEWGNVDGIINSLNDPLQHLSDLTEGDFPTIVFDATGNHHSMNQSFNYVAHGGKIVFVGLTKEKVTFSDPIFHAKEITLMASRNATRVDFEQVIHNLHSGQISIEGYLSHRCKFDQLISQFNHWLLPESNVIKAIVEF